MDAAARHHPPERSGTLPASREFARYGLAALAALALAFGLAAPQARAQVPMVFEVPSDRHADSIYVQFLGDTIDGYYMGDNGEHQTLKTWTPYQLSSLSKSSVGHGAPNDNPSVMINDFPAGRVYINFGGGDGKGGLDMSNKAIPDPSNESDPNFKKRYQFFEPTASGHQMNVNLSYIDFFSIPLSLQGVNAGHGANTTMSTSGSGKDFASAASGAATTSGANVYPSGSLDKFATFVRVLTPHSPPLGGDDPYYHDWSFLKDLKDNNVAHLEDFFVGGGGQPANEPRLQQQAYTYTATFDTSGNVSMTGHGDGKASFIPKDLQGDGVAENTISITFSELNAHTGIYGENPHYSVTNYNNTGNTHSTNGTENDIYGRVVGDLVAGLTWGFVSSTATFNGKTLGTLPSAYWWGGRLFDGTTVTNSAAKAGIVFEKAQPDHSDRYDHYAAAIRNMTDGYAFPLQDRAGSTLMNFNSSQDTNAYLKVTIGHD